MDTSRAGKLCGLRTAIGGLVKDGDTLFLSGMQHGEPSAAIHELLRQGTRDLTLVPQLPETAQLLLAEGRVSRLLTAYSSVLDLRRGVMSKRAARTNFELVEFSHGALANALLAGQLGIPYIPTTALLASDYLTVNPSYFITIKDPFKGDPLVAVRSITPDVAIIHVQYADRTGNAVKFGSLGMDLAGVHASRRVLVTAERIVEPDEIQAMPNATTIPGLHVDAVAHVPWGAWPQHLNGCYRDDLGTWMRMFPDEASYLAFLHEAVYGVEDRNGLLEYLRQRFGSDHFEGLKQAATAPNLALDERMQPA